MSNKFNIKNYTTTIDAEKTIMEIEKLLSLFGAQAIIKEYSQGGKIIKLSFKINDNAFKLPADIEGVKKILFSSKSKSSNRVKEDRAYRVAWRIIKDWIHSQLSLIKSGQAEPQQVFFPYMYDGQRTLYQAYVEGKLLPSKEENEGD